MKTVTHLNSYDRMSTHALLKLAEAYSLTKTIMPDPLRDAMQRRRNVIVLRSKLRAVKALALEKQHQPLTKWHARLLQFRADRGHAHSQIALDNHEAGVMLQRRIAYLQSKIDAITLTTSGKRWF